MGADTPPSISNMRECITWLLAGDHADDVVDLCLDWSLLGKDLREPFTEIAGLEPFPALESLSISMHDLRSGHGLRHLHSLRNLNLSHNAIEELGDIPALPRLVLLDISHNALSDLTGLEALVELRELHVGFNPLTSTLPLQALAALETLQLTGCTQLDHLHGLPPSIRHLYLGKCFLQDHEAVGKLTSLQSLLISPGGNSAFAALDGHLALERLRIQAGRMNGQILLPRLPNLQHLVVQRAMTVTGILFAAPSTQLRVLEFQHCPFQALPNLEACPLLERLSVKHSPLQSLSGIEGLSALKHLELEGSAIPAQELARLKKRLPQLEITF